MRFCCFAIVKARAVAVPKFGFFAGNAEFTTNLEGWQLRKVNLSLLAYEERKLTGLPSFHLISQVCVANS